MASRESTSEHVAAKGGMVVVQLQLLITVSRPTQFCNVLVFSRRRIRMYKKKLLIILIIIAILSVMTVISNAATNGVITGETVKLREGPSLDAGLVTLLSVDNKVEVLGKEGDWYQVKYKEYEGYVYADYIDVEGEVIDNTATTNQVTNNSVENTINSVVNVVSNLLYPLSY